METKDQDWPYLNKYKEENAAINDPESGKTDCFMGDSITEFWCEVNSFVINSINRESVDKPLRKCFMIN
jgi:hypothetical protein